MESVRKLATDLVPGDIIDIGFHNLSVWVTVEEVCTVEGYGQMHAIIRELRFPIRMPMGSHVHIKGE